MGDEYLWLMGEGELLDRLLKQATEDIETGDYVLTLGGTGFSTAEGTVILTVRNPANRNLGVGVILSGDIDEATALAGRLPHYSKYSYLGFTGGRPVVKGKWESGDSPLALELIRR
jgi:hypothetical protein